MLFRCCRAELHSTMSQVGSSADVQFGKKLRFLLREIVKQVSFKSIGIFWYLMEIV